jgi:5'-deoxynucleotidase YfbR-like HD superfamily hydrolase
MSSIEEFYSQIYNLSHIQRYSTVPRVRSESVAEHSFFVACIVIRLHKEYDFDLGAAVVMATMHDWTESWLDDVTVPTKRKFPKLALAVQEAEAQIAATEFPDNIYQLWLEHKEHLSVESKIVHYADVIQCMQYAGHEVKISGNSYMAKVLQETEERINEIEEELHVYRR